MLEHRGLREKREESFALPLVIGSFGDNHAVEKRSERLRIPASELRPLLPRTQVARGKRAAPLLKPRPPIARRDLAVDLHQVTTDLVVAYDPFAPWNVRIVDRAMNRR